MHVHCSKKYGEKFRCIWLLSDRIFLGFVCLHVSFKAGTFAIIVKIVFII